MAVGESRSERAFVNLCNAVEDVNLAIHTAHSPADLRQVRTVIQDTIAKLIISSSVALTLDELWEQR